jgi:cytochrome P450
MSGDFIPPKPRNRPDRVSMWQHMKLFRKDIFASQPQKLYRAWMAEFRLPFFRSYFINDPKLVDHVLNKDPDNFPKSQIIKGALYSLLGDGVFVSNGEAWKRQRRIIDPAFEGGRLRDVFPSMVVAAEDAITRLQKLSENDAPIEMEEQASQLAADIIFRTLFSIPITDNDAKQIFEKFQNYQRTQPLMTVASFLKIPKWIPMFQHKGTKQTSADIRKLLAQLTHTRAEEIKAGTAPDDLATKIMTTADPVTGEIFSPSEMVDQVAIFFLAGHETSASALAWALYLLSVDQDTQQRVADEVAQIDEITFANLSKLRFTRDVFREALRLYPPVPMMIRENLQQERFRDRKIKVGSQIVLSPWHLHRHERLWDRPDVFDPDRWQTNDTKKCAREAYMPFSSGQRVCTGAGFAMIEGVLMIAMLVRAFKMQPSGKAPIPVAHLTVRAEDGIHIRLSPRASDTS